MIHTVHAHEATKWRDRFDSVAKWLTVILLLLIFLHSHGFAQGVKSTGKADSAGNVLVDTVGHNKASYRFSVTGQTPIAGVIAALCGSATTTVRVTRATWSFST